MHHSLSHLWNVGLGLNVRLNLDPLSDPHLFVIKQGLFYLPPGNQGRNMVVRKE